MFTIVVGIQDHGAENWILGLMFEGYRPKKIFWGHIYIQNGLSSHIVCGGHLFTLKIKFLGSNGI